MRDSVLDVGSKEFIIKTESDTSKKFTLHTKAGMISI